VSGAWDGSGGRGAGRGPTSHHRPESSLRVGTLLHHTGDSLGVTGTPSGAAQSPRVATRGHSHLLGGGCRGFGGAAAGQTSGWQTAEGWRQGGTGQPEGCPPGWARCREQSPAPQQGLPGARQLLQPLLAVGPVSRLFFFFSKGNGHFSKLHKISLSDLIPRTSEQVLFQPAPGRPCSLEDGREGSRWGAEHTFS